MEVFETHRSLIEDYAAFTDSLVEVRDERIKRHLAEERAAKVRWPDPWISLNPTFAPGGTVDELVADGLLHPDCARFFGSKSDADDPGTRSLALYRHQREAIEAARRGGNYVLTTGTGSGKSLSYIIPIVDAVLREPRPNRISAIVVYPMNALANSQLLELEKYLQWGIPTDRQPVTFQRYTGQESAEKRQHILNDRPDILLTNYVMLEYILTRPHERRSLIGAAADLRFLVLDELHTYRGRQGADVALLARRLRDACAAPSMQCVGTSATMSSKASFEAVQHDVAKVAGRLFGTEVAPDRVIGETLERATVPRVVGDEELRAALDQVGVGLARRAFVDLADDPLAIWVEDTFGLDVGPDSRLVRRQPTTIPAAAEVLANRTGRPPKSCEAAIRGILAEGASTRHPEHGRPLFAFRLHQFLSKGDTVHVSLEPPADRHVTSQYQVSVPHARDKLLLPLSFCRECGQEYLVVARDAQAGWAKYLGRREAVALESDTESGYLYISDDHPWPADPIAAGRLPDTWFDVDEHGNPYVLPRLADRLPRKVRIATDGTELDDGVPPDAAAGSVDSRSTRGIAVTAWFVTAPFRFCLRCRVSYEQLRAQDFAKLASYSAEGRSSAVSLVSTSVVRSLRRQPDLTESAKKLLTFVDNRQDASLQAGHLNDFVQVTQLRGALHRAARVAGTDGLRFETVAERVTDALDLPLSSFSAIDEPMFSQRDNILRALRAAIGYRVYADLERGWRVTMPNLEQTGLLTFDYVDLDAIAQHQPTWAETHALLRDDAPDHRALLARILLDEMRRALAVDVDALSQVGHERIVQSSDHLLRGVWAIPPDEPRVLERTVYPFSGSRGGLRDAVHVTGRGAFGRYLRRPREFVHFRGRVRMDDAEAMIGNLFAVLERHGLIGTVDATGPGRNRRQPAATGYRVKASALIWRAGDGQRGADDPLRRVIDDSVGARVNPFFRDLYAHQAEELVGIEAREHTAQVPAKIREEREDAFRRGGDPASGGLPLLYCSPTMELGVDIADLNTVMMRNVPPTPANYAQRSGRAGRGGQPALVTTYCSTGSAHDQYYFRRAERMVSGSVSPPRLDLANEDLARSHVHAIWLAESGASLHRSLPEILDITESPTGELPLPIRPELAEALDDPGVRVRAVQRATAALEGDMKNDSTWWYREWISDVVRGAFLAFDRACDRWRTMYRQAIVDQREQNRRVLDRSTEPRARSAARRRRFEAEQRLALLTNESDARELFSDFYSYRYFASEGFLPGYAFPRLPLAAYIPAGRRRDGTYIQRPRFIAIGEFGPGALIYHEGGRYQVTSVQVPGAEPGVPGSVATVEARLCDSCGYWHQRDAAVNRCEECGAVLGASQAGLMHLQTVTTVHRRRISSDEEERRRAGFELLTTYRFAAHGARSGRLAADVVIPAGADSADGPALAEYVYGDTATIRVINRGLRRRAVDSAVGYLLDTVNGRWLSEKKAGELTAEESGLEEFADDPRARRIVPYVEDRRNIAVFRLARPVSEEVATSVRYALERGIEAHFQLEDAELESQRLPDPDGRGRMLFIESAEGGAGVLRRLHDEREALAQVAAEALRIIHIDPETGADLDHAPNARERCERGCYDCLLSYHNQVEHLLIDRLSAVDLLRTLMEAQTITRHGHADGVAGHVEALRERAGSSLERELVTFLREEGYRLPDATQILVSEAAARPDFVYRLASGSVAVFVDGPHHDAGEVGARDTEAEDRLADLGWLVVRFRYDAEWGSIVARYPNVFGRGRRG